MQVNALEFKKWVSGLTEESLWNKPCYWAKTKVTMYWAVGLWHSTFICVTTAVGWMFPKLSWYSEVELMCRGTSFKYLYMWKKTAVGCVEHWHDRKQGAGQKYALYKFVWNNKLGCVEIWIRRTSSFLRGGVKKDRYLVTWWGSIEINVTELVPKMSHVGYLALR